MKAKMMNVVAKIGRLTAAPALIVSVVGAGRGCWYMLYRPELTDIKV